MTNSEFAKRLGIKPTSISHRVCITGAYFGLKPKKFPNGRLYWPDDAIEILAGKKSQGADHATVS